MTDASKSRGISRRAFIVGAAAVATAGAMLLGNFAKRSYDSPSLTFYDALEKPELRQKFLDGVYREWNDPSIQCIIYDPDKKQLRGHMEKRGMETVAITRSEGGYTITAKEYRQWKPETLENETSLHKDSAIACFSDVLAFGQGKPSTLFVSERLFSGFEKESPPRREAAFYSGLEHDRVHARDIYNGIDLGDGYRIGNEEAIALLAVGLFDEVGEIRAYSKQIHALHEKLGEFPAMLKESYQDSVKKLEEGRKNLGWVAETKIAGILDRFMQQQYSDLLLARFLK